MMQYGEFIEQKTTINHDYGFQVDCDAIHEMLYPFQRAAVVWAIAKGRAALFEDCGLGKTLQQLEWLRLVTKERGLIVCPLSVADQTIREAERIGIDLAYVRTQAEAGGRRFSITNYERLHEFDGSCDAVVLDESSILKSIGGKTKNLVLKLFRDVPYRLSCTATPSPNDISEMANQVAYLGIMSREEMLSKFFVHDGEGWRLKGHAHHDFYRWMASWAIFMRHPSDVGFDDAGFLLPELSIDALYTDVDMTLPGELFVTGKLKGIQDRHRVRAETIPHKVEALRAMIEASDDQWLVWCGLNKEADMVTRALDGAEQIRGQDTIESKIDRFMRFKSGELRVMVTKPRIAGFGMNFQNCHRMAFVGLSDSFEAYYQCIRRCWRFGQEDPVDVHIVLAKAEQAILGNVKRKEEMTAQLIDSVIGEMADFSKDELHSGTVRLMDTYMEESRSGEGWEMHLGDSAEVVKRMESESVDFSIYSPPFPSLYTYSPSPRDLGNTHDYDEFWEQWDYMIPELRRVMKPGRIMAVHCMMIPTTQVKDGVIGLRDFRGDIIRHFVAQGFIHHGEVVIPKNPQAQAIRNHSKSLMFVQLEKDASWMRPALPDYLCIFRTPGENTVPVHNGNDGGEVDRDRWIYLAKGIWDDVDETDTLNMREARANDDERHMCPLQLPVIKNAVQLWSNPEELVFSPFGGIGSEGYQALLSGRRFVGVELKAEYFEVACKNLTEAARLYAEGDMPLFAETAP